MLLQLGSCATQRRPARAPLSPVSPSADAPLPLIAEALREYDVRRLVVEAKGTPVGIVSQTDLIQVVEEFDWGWELHQ